MFSQIVPYLRDLVASLRVADAVDVLVFAAIVYGGFVWFRQARTRFVMLGVVALVAVYTAARLLDLTLTLVLFQAGITVALVALVVIFQEEIRRTFERLGNPRALRKGRGADPARWVDDIVGSVSTMARARTGALIVFKGREPLDRHLQGGSALDGRISQPLLLSIFDSSSPGHDGAVIVDEGVVRSFGVHLPLSTHIAGNEQFGTRHTAALGLSECSDALVVVVSEERGEISLAKDGKLEKLDGASDLGARIRTFLTSVAPVHQVSALRSLARNLAPKVLALLVAVVTWVLVVGPQGERVGRSYRVPIMLRKTPSNMMLDQPRPPDVLITLSGTERAFRRLDPASLVVAVDAEEIRAGAQLVRIGQDAIELPQGLLLDRIDPDAITLVANETIVHDYPVHVVTTGKLDDGLMLRDTHTEPEKVRLVVRKSDAGTFSRVDTEVVDLAELTGTASITRPLSVPPGARFDASAPTKVRIVLTVGRKK